MLFISAQIPGDGLDSRIYNPLLASPGRVSASPMAQDGSVLSSGHRGDSSRGCSSRNPSERGLGAALGAAEALSSSHPSLPGSLTAPISMFQPGLAGLAQAQGEPQAQLCRGMGAVQCLTGPEGIPELSSCWALTAKQVRKECWKSEPQPGVPQASPGEPLPKGEMLLLKGNLCK